jgi:hypothetical protein
MRFYLKMIHKRGLSPDEIDNLDPDLFQYLYLYDQVLEPNGTYYDMVKFSNLCHLLLVTSGNISKEGMRKASPNDWDLFGILSGKSTKERREEMEKAELDKFNSMAEMIKSQATGNKNGTK